MLLSPQQRAVLAWLPLAALAFMTAPLHAQTETPKEFIAWGTFGSDEAESEATATVHLGLDSSLASALGAGRPEGPSDVAGLRTMLDISFGYFFDSAWGLGGGLLVGNAGSADDTAFCAGQGDVDCGSIFAGGFRLYVQRLFHPRARLRSWASAGVGWTGLVETASSSGTSGEVSHAYRGPELLNLQIGGDYKLGQTNWYLGGYVGYSLALYLSESVECDEGCVEQSAAHSDLAHWFGLGLRGAYWF